MSSSASRHERAFELLRNWRKSNAPLTLTTSHGWPDIEAGEVEARVSSVVDDRVGVLLLKADRHVDVALNGCSITAGRLVETGTRGVMRSEVSPYFETVEIVLNDADASLTLTEVVR